MTALPIDPSVSYRLSGRSTLVVLAFGISLLIAGIGGGIVLTRHEVLAAEPAREMLLFNHWIIPHFAGIPRLVKPPTMGWCIALAMKITGSMADWVPRVPSLIAGVVVGWTIARVAARFFGDTIGLLAGLIQLSSVYLLMQARLAEADMPLAACVTVAMGVIAIANLDGPVPRATGKGWPILFYFAIGLACLFKGPVGLIFTLPACMIYALVARDRKVARFLLDPIGLLVFLVVASSWYVVAAKVQPEIVNTWRAELHNRTQGEGDLTEGVQPWHFYLWNVLWLILPWTPLTVVGCIAWWIESRFRTPIYRFLVLWFGVGLVLLSWSAWKHKHYILPALPSLSVPAAVGMMIWIRHQHGKPIIVWQYIASAVGYAVAILVAIAIVLFRRIDGGGAIAVVLGLILAGGLIVLGAEYRRWKLIQIIAIFATAWCAIFAALVGVMRYHDDYRPSAQLGRFVSSFAKPEQTIYLVGLREAHVAYYTRFPMKRFDDDLDATNQLSGQGLPLLVLTRKGSVDKLRGLGSVEVIAWSPRVSRSESDEDLLTFIRIDRPR